MASSLIHIACIDMYFRCMCVGLQEEGLDTVDANRALGLPDDCREYSSVKNILNDLGIKSIRLMVCLISLRC